MFFIIDTFELFSSEFRTILLPKLCKTFLPPPQVQYFNNYQNVNTSIQQERHFSSFADIFHILISLNLTISKCIKKAITIFALATKLLVIFIEDYYNQLNFSSMVKFLKNFSKLLTNNQHSSPHRPTIRNNIYPSLQQDLNKTRHSSQNQNTTAIDRQLIHPRRNRNFTTLRVHFNIPS